MDINILGYRVNLEIIILMGVLYIILMGHLVGGCCHVKRGTGTGKEGFYGGSPLTQSITGSPMPFNENTGTPPSTWGTQEYFNPATVNRWGVPNMAVVPGQPVSAAIQSVLDRPSTLGEGNLDVFAKTKFTPEACSATGSSYSSSTGCAALSPQDYNLLVTRGGGNVPYSEY